MSFKTSKLNRIKKKKKKSRLYQDVTRNDNEFKNIVIITHR